MEPRYPVAPVEIGRRARDAEHAVIAARREMQPLGRIDPVLGSKLTLD
jgi:hypothetical protein